MSDREALQKIAELNRDVGQDDAGFIVAWLQVKDILRELDPPIEPVTA